MARYQISSKSNVKYIMLTGCIDAAWVAGEGERHLANPPLEVGKRLLVLSVSYGGRGV